MNRLVLVPCVVVVASYAALASYIAWPTIVYEHGRPRAALNIPTSDASRGETRNYRSSPTEQTNPVHLQGGVGALGSRECKLEVENTGPIAVPQSNRKRPRLPRQGF